MDYWREFDFSKSFTEQFGELMRDVPLCSIYNINSENSDYTNICAFNKNCYMLIESSNNDDCYHGYWLQKSKNCMDCAMLNSSELCYGSIDLDNCYKVVLSRYCRECSSSFLLENCTGCKFCFWCVGQDWKMYMIFNEQKTKEEFEKVTTLYLFWTKEQQEMLFKQYRALSRTIYTHIRNSDNVTGDYVYGAENIKLSTEIHDAKNVIYSKHVRFNAGDCMDVDTVWYNAFLMYESINTALDAYNNKFCMRCWSWCNNLLYCFNVDALSNSFSCIGLRNKSYCIFNKQYTKEWYEKQVAKIIAHMQETWERGEFFHPSLSPFGYNETVAQEYFPVTKNEEWVMKNEQWIALQSHGYKRSDYNADPVIPAGAQTLQGDQIPHDIATVTDDILKSIFVCEVSGRPYRIIKQELEFYRKHTLPLPRKHPDIRHEERMKLRPGRTLFLRNCDKCSEEMLSVYADSYEGKVYCEKCYQEEVYA